ncbi:hypothetical protein GCM10027057_14620 [Marisediminicola antarctica]
MRGEHSGKAPQIAVGHPDAVNEYEGRPARRYRGAREVQAALEPALADYQRWGQWDDHRLRIREPP